MKGPTIDEFAELMIHEGHTVFRCKSCLAVLWLEADDPETMEGLQMMRYCADSFPDDCPSCSYLLGQLADENEDWFNVFEMVVAVDHGE